MRQFLTKMFRTQSPKMALGRWNTQDSHEIKSILANYDNCGDKICRDPEILNKHLEKVHYQRKIERLVGKR